MRFHEWLDTRQRVATFDFDSTCTVPIYDGENELWMQGDGPNHSNLKEMRRLASLGYTIFIVTSRSESERQEVEDFVQKHQLPVRAIYCTNGDKGAVLASLGSEIHYDDMPQRTDDVNGMHPGKWVKVYHPADFGLQQ